MHVTFYFLSVRYIFPKKSLSFVQILTAVSDNFNQIQEAYSCNNHEANIIIAS